MNGFDEPVGVGGDDRGGFGKIATDPRWFPEAGKGEGFAGFEAKIDRAALAEGIGFPFVKSVGRQQAAALAQGVFECALGPERLRAVAVDRGAYHCFNVFRVEPERLTDVHRPDL